MNKLNVIVPEIPAEILSYIFSFIKDKNPLFFLNKDANQIVKDLERIENNIYIKYPEYKIRPGPIFKDLDIQKTKNICKELKILNYNIVAINSNNLDVIKWAIDTGDKSMFYGNEWDIIVYNAIKYGYEEIIKLFITKDINYDEISKYRKTYIYKYNIVINLYLYAGKANNINIVNIIFQNYDKLFSLYALYGGLESGNIQFCNEIINKYSLDITFLTNSSFYINIYKYAAKSGKKEVVEYILSRVDHDLLNNDKLSELSMGAGESGSLELIEYLKTKNLINWEYAAIGSAESGNFKIFEYAFDNLVNIFNMFKIDTIIESVIKGGNILIYNKIKKYININKFNINDKKKFCTISSINGSFEIFKIMYDSNYDPEEIDSYVYNMTTYGYFDMIIWIIQNSIPNYFNRKINSNSINWYDCSMYYAKNNCKNLLLYCLSHGQFDIMKFVNDFLNLDININIQYIIIDYLVLYYYFKDINKLIQKSYNLKYYIIIEKLIYLYFTRKQINNKLTYDIENNKDVITFINNNSNLQKFITHKKYYY